MQKPSVGRIVFVPVSVLGAVGNNGADIAPAIITRVWSDGLVNLRVFVDGDDVVWKTSVALVESADEAEGQYACYWPPRV